jgi:hypothetical protein
MAVKEVISELNKMASKVEGTERIAQVMFALCIVLYIYIMSTSSTRWPSTVEGTERIAEVMFLMVKYMKIILHKYMHSCIHTCIHTHTHIHTYAHTYMHTNIHRWQPSRPTAKRKLETCSLRPWTA